MKRIKKKDIIIILATFLVIMVLELIFFAPNIKGLLKINRILNIIDKNFYYEYNQDELIDYALTGIAVATNDPFAHYYTEEQFELYKNSSENSYIGTGMVLGATSDNKNVKILAILKNSSAEKIGLQVGDIVLKINDETLTPENLKAISKEIKGNIDTTIKLEISRNNDVFTTEVVNQVVDKNNVETKIFDNIGYLKILSFDRKNTKDPESIDTFDEFKKKIEEIKAQNINKLILDLRDNTGGDMDVCIKIADYLLPECELFYTQDKKGKRSSVYSDGEFADMEIVVLVNEKTASASEILAGTLRCNSDTILVGKTTYGKGIIQTIYYFPDGTGFALTTAEYFLPDGERVNKSGILPNHIIEDSELQLKKAMELLS